MSAQTDPAATVSAETYEAFISYRHASRDRYWAVWLHRKLEAYHLPKRLARSRGLPRRLRRIFRDEEEVRAAPDLSTEIERALVASRFLIVVCSPRTPESRWIAAEIARFRDLGRKDRILALLIEGDPAQSFPAPLRTPADPSAAADALTLREPLAADVRPDAESWNWTRRRMALLRLLAAVHGISFDELRQRDQERRIRNLLIGSAIILLVGISFAVLAGYAMLQRSAALQAQADAVEARDQAEERLTSSLLAESDALRRTGQWSPAQARLDEAYVISTRRHFNLLAVDLRELDLNLEVSSPISSWRASNAHIDHVVADSEGREATAVSRDGVVRRWDLRTHTVLREQSTAFPADDPLLRAVLSVDGRTAAFAQWSGTITIVDVASGTALRTLQADSEPWVIAFSPDGQRVLAGSMDGVRFPESQRPRDHETAIRVWDTQSGNPLRALPEDGPVSTALFAAAGRVVVSCALHELREFVRVWDVASGRMLREIETPWSASGGSSALAVSPDGSRLALGGEQGIVQVWDLESGAEHAPITTGAHLVTALAFSPDGSQLAVGTADGVQMWSVPSGRRLMTLSSDGVYPTSLAFIPRTELLLASLNNRGLAVWNFEAADEARQLAAEDTGGTEVSLSDAAPVAFSLDTEAAPRLWDLVTGRRLLLPPGNDLSASDVGFFASGQDALAVNPLLELTVWNLASAAIQRSLHAPPRIEMKGQRFLSRLRADASGDRVTVTLRDGRGLVVDLRSGEMLRAFGEPRSETRETAITPDGRTVLVADEEGRLSVWDATTATLLRQYDIGKNASAIATSPDGSIAYVALGERIDAWDLRAGHILPPAFASSSRVTRLAVSSDGSVLAAATDTVEVWDVASRRLLYAFLPGSSRTTYVGFSNSGDRLVSATSAGDLRVLDLTRPQALRDGQLAAANAFERLAQAPSDGDASANLGNWYALRGAWSWAVDLLSYARSQGTPVETTTFARALWMLGRFDLAAEEFAAAQPTATEPQPYLDMCRGANAAGIMQGVIDGIRDGHLDGALFAAERAAELLPDGLWMKRHAHYLAARLLARSTSGPDRDTDTPVCSASGAVLDHLQAASNGETSVVDRILSDPAWYAFRDHPRIRKFYVSEETL